MPRRFGDLQPRYHGPGFAGPGKTCRVQSKKVPGLGKNMPCARNKGSWSRKKHAVCKTKRFLVSEKNMSCAKQKVSWYQKKHAVCKKKVRLQKKLVLRPPKLISQNRDPHSAGISVKVGIPIWARLFMSRLFANLD